MAAQISRIFSVLLFISTLTVLFMFWKHVSYVSSWTVFLVKYHQRGSILFKSEIIHIRENMTSLDAVLTSNKTKYDSAKKSPKTTQKPEQLITSSKRTIAETPMPVLSIKSFKKLPEWDFDDIYNQDEPPRLTTCAQSLRNSKDEKFRKAFLPNIRLYLHKDNINMSEWNRLSHFNNPFGFMALKYEEVMPAVKLIPKPKEPLLHQKPGGDGCVHCAVVGTSGILNGSKMGTEIDAHDYVFRMNGAVIKGYEEDVGNRTSVYVHTAHSINASPYFFGKYGYKAAPHDEGIKYVMIPEGMRDYNWLLGLLKGEKVPPGPYQNKWFLKSSNLNKGFWAIVRPTNGAFALFLALHTCDTVDAYGFITEDYQNYSNYYVERSIKTRIHFYANHDYILEKNVWKDLHDRKIIKLYQRSSSQTVTEKPSTH
ncbi:alpha-N-acetylgalactosaminide alpha-2,6-sialyltransferase 1-like isoform 2-T2 [Pholidichthys leucotaenia]